MNLRRFLMGIQWSILGVSTLLLAHTALPNQFQTTADIQSEVNFLTGSLLFQGDGSFQTIDALLPTSYYTNNIDFWGNYICATSNCSVKDIAYFDPYAIAPQDPNSQGGMLQEERVFSTHGADIYDAATWQIALALTDANNAVQLINNENKRLDKITVRATACDKFNAGQGKCANNGFSYGYGESATNIQNLQYAYSFRMLGPHYLINDPFKGTGYGAYIADGPKVPQEQQQQITWADWKPISGENGWAFLLGPIQSANLLAHGLPVKTTNLGLTNALDFLWALQRMQTPIGAFYYAMRGSDGNTGQPVPVGEISVENNASILAGLHVLQKTIQAIPGWQQDPKLNAANNVIDIMLFGGAMPQGGNTTGLLSYFKNQAWHANEDTFYQGGTYVNGKFTPTLEPFALDVNTWTISALGPKVIDSWHGTGTAFKVWEEARTKAGYFGPLGTLWGVGYTDQSSKTAEKVLSGEWTAGAINMVHSLILYYEKNPGISKKQLNSLKDDQKSMLSALLKLRNDHYHANDFKHEGGVEARYLTKLATNEKAVLYASRRYNIPFGWHANPIPSTASTSWTIMLSYWYNPLGYQGSMNSPDFETVPSYTQTADQLYHAPKSVTVLNELKDQQTQDYILPITVSYNTSANPDHWVKLTSIDNGSWADISIPDDAQTIGVSYTVNGQWYSACQVTLNSEVRSELEGSPLHTDISASWESPDGNGPCSIMKN